MYRSKNINKQDWRRTVEPVTEPVTLAEIKTYLKIDGTDEDAILTSLIQPAREIVEAFLNRSLITQTWLRSADRFCKDTVQLKKPPVQSITSVTTFDEGNNSSVYASTNYFLKNDQLVFNDNADIPSELRNNWAYDIEYVTGYGNAGSDVPAAIRQGIIFQVEAMYECVCNCKEVIGDISPLAKTALFPYRINSREVC